MKTNTVTKDITKTFSTEEVLTLLRDLPLNRSSKLFSSCISALVRKPKNFYRLGGRTSLKR